MYGEGSWYIVYIFIHPLNLLYITFLGGKGRPARKADNLTAICEPIV
jgi:hypothetical protein